MAYKPEEYKEMKIGEPEKAKVVEIKEGTLGDFVSPESWNKFDPEGRTKPEHEAIEIRTNNNARLLIKLPQNKELHPKSLLAKWKRTYGKLPQVGDPVNTVNNEDGFREIMLSK